MRPRKAHGFPGIALSLKLKGKRKSSQVKHTMSTTEEQLLRHTLSFLVQNNAFSDAQQRALDDVWARNDGVVIQLFRKYLEGFADSLSSVAAPPKELSSFSSLFSNHGSFAQPKKSTTTIVSTINSEPIKTNAQSAMLSKNYGAASFVFQSTPNCFYYQLNYTPRNLVPEVAEYIKNNLSVIIDSNIYKFYWSYAELTNSDVTMLCKAMLKWPKLRTICFSYTGIGDDCIQDIMNVVTSPDNCIDELILVGNNITDVGVNIILQSLAKNPPLTNLVLSHNGKITEQSLCSFGDMLRKNSHLTRINLSATYVTNRVVKAIYEGLKHNANHKIKYLDLVGWATDNPFVASDVDAIISQREEISL